MKITHYYFRVEHGTQLKNKLQKELYEEYLQLNGVIVDKEQLDYFIGHIKSTAKIFSAEHKRCKAIELRVWHNEGIIHFCGFEQISMKLYPARMYL